MTDPKYEAAVAALREAHQGIVVVPRVIYNDHDYWPHLLDAMLANPQPFLAVLLRVDAVADAWGYAVGSGWKEGDEPLPHAREQAERIIAALTETAAEPDNVRIREGKTRPRYRAEPAHGIAADVDRMSREWSEAEPARACANFDCRDLPHHEPHAEPARSKEPTDG